MKFLNVFAALAVTVFLAGCASPYTDGLKNLEEPRGMLIAEPISFVLGGSARMMAGTQVGLLPSYYVATKENENGTFYRGAGLCLWYKEKEQYRLSTGGVWLPKSPANPPRLFTILGDPSATVKTLDETVELCKQPKTSNAAIGMTNADLQIALVANPRSLGIAPQGPNGTLSNTQLAGGIIGLAIVQASIDSAKGEYVPLQIVDDAVALRKMEEAIQLANTVQKR